MGPLALNAQHSPFHHQRPPAPPLPPGLGLGFSPTRAVEWNKAPVSLWG